jgi:hypothetical protein
MIKRTPEAIVVAHTMDRSRRELYVEGRRDRLFLGWLTSDSADSRASILEIEFVELPGPVLGGNKARLIQFANWLGDKEIQIRMFADADWDRALGRQVPERVWLTDHRDMEGYILCEQCIDKILRLGMGIADVSANALLAAVLQQCRPLGLLRILSELDNLNLPFQNTNLIRHVEGMAERVTVDFDTYLRALLQNAEISLTRTADIQARLRTIGPRFSSVPDRDMVHGSDAVQVFEVALRKRGISQGESERLLWTSFESSFVAGGSTLETVASYMRGH